MQTYLHISIWLPVLAAAGCRDFVRDDRQETMLADNWNHTVIAVGEDFRIEDLPPLAGSADRRSLESIVAKLPHKPMGPVAAGETPYVRFEGSQPRVVMFHRDGPDRLWKIEGRKLREVNPEKDVFLEVWKAGLSRVKSADEPVGEPPDVTWVHTIAVDEKGSRVLVDYHRYQGTRDVTVDLNMTDRTLTIVAHDHDGDYRSKSTFEHLADEARLLRRFKVKQRPRGYTGDDTTMYPR